MENSDQIGLSGVLLNQGGARDALPALAFGQCFFRKGGWIVTARHSDSVVINATRTKPAFSSPVDKRAAAKTNDGGSTLAYRTGRGLL